MAWKFNEEKPIFKQIVDVVVKDIVSGRYKPGDKLPTVRELAVEAEVNPNTMQKAFVEIERLGLIYTKRGDGRYVTDNRKELEVMANITLKESTKGFIEKMIEMGFQKMDILETVKGELEKGGKDGNVGKM